MKLILIVMCLLLTGCATIATRGKVIQENGKDVYVPEEYIKIRGIGEAEFPEGYKIKGKPIIEFPPIKYEAD